MLKRNICTIYFQNFNKIKYFEAAIVITYEGPFLHF